MLGIYVDLHDVGAQHALLHAGSSVTQPFGRGCSQELVNGVFAYKVVPVLTAALTPGGDARGGHRGVGLQRRAGGGRHAAARREWCATNGPGV